MDDSEDHTVVDTVFLIFSCCGSRRVFLFRHYIFKAQNHSKYKETVD